jgi:hypothetical protein
LRDLERPAGFAAEAYVCRNLARIDLVTESRRISLQWQHEAEKLMHSPRVRC